MGNKKNQRRIRKAITSDNVSYSVKYRPGRERMSKRMKRLSKIAAKMRHKVSVPMECREFRNREHWDRIAHLIRSELEGPVGRVATFEDKLYALRIFGNFMMSNLIESYSDACELTAIALQMSNKTVARIVREFSNKDGDICSTAEGDASRRGINQVKIL